MSFIGFPSAKTSLLLTFAFCNVVSAQTQATSHSTGAAQGTHYLALIDAGSSGSRIFLFAWHSLDHGALPDLIPVRNPTQENKEFKMVTKPGLSSVHFKTPRDAARSLEPLVNFVKSYLGPKELAETYIFLNATAGMRLIAPERANAILAEVRKLFNEAGFKVDKNVERVARIIDGDEEGLYKDLRIWQKHVSYLHPQLFRAWKKSSV